MTTVREQAGPGPSTTAPPEKGSARHSKKRVRNFTADDRAAHRLFEKSRREAFKERLNELATHLPSLSDTEPQRLSKHIVINESIARHKLLHTTCVDALDTIRALMQERDELLTEINTWRNSAGLGVRQPVEVNVDNLVTLEAEAQRLPSLISPGHGGQYNSDSSINRAEDPTQAQSNHSTATITASDPPAIPPESLPEAVVMAPHPLEGMGLESSWSPSSQDMVPFQSASQPNDRLMPIEDAANIHDQPEVNPLMSVPQDIDPYHIFGDVTLDQPISPAIPDPVPSQHTLPDTQHSTVYDPLNMHISLDDLGAMGLSPSTLLRQSEPWVVWP